MTTRQISGDETLALAAAKINCDGSGFVERWRPRRQHFASREMQSDHRSHTERPTIFAHAAWDTQPRVRHGRQRSI